MASATHLPRSLLSLLLCNPLLQSSNLCLRLPHLCLCSCLSCSLPLSRLGCCSCLQLGCAWRSSLPIWVLADISWVGFCIETSAAASASAPGVMLPVGRRPGLRGLVPAVLVPAVHLQGLQKVC